MSEAFVIIQIGNPELDRVCNLAIVPALKACGLEPKRVDKHNQGGLLKSEIVAFIENSEIIVADLTNERPNCYLEVGYAMGIDKFRNLILTAREDHNQDSPNHRPGGPKVHFDLRGYDVLFWNPDDLDKFRDDLEKLVHRRQAILVPAGETRSPWDQGWLERHRAVAKAGLARVGMSAFMEVTFSLSNSKPSRSQRDLLKAADSAQIHTFGWPIAVVMHNVDEYRPKPKADGIVAEIATQDKSSYDYWAIRKDGDFFLFKSLFEDTRLPRHIFYDTRVVRTTETLLYCSRLYAQLGVPTTTPVNIRVRYGGLAGRTIGKTGGSRRPGVISREDEVNSEIHVPLARIESELVELVKQLTQPVFIVFDFFELPDTSYAALVNNFVARTAI